MPHPLCQLHAVGHGVRALDGGDDALRSGQFKESVQGLLVGDHIVLHTAQIVQECVFGAGRGIVQSAGDRVNGSRLSVFILQHDAVEAVHDALCSIGQAGGMVPQSGASAQRLHAVDIHGVIQEAGKQPHGVGAAAHTGHHGVRQFAGHLQELRSRLHADHALEVTNHHGERMRPRHGADAVDRVFVFPFICGKGGVHGLFQRPEALRHFNDSRSQNLHAGHIGRLLFDVHRTHVDVALQPEVGGRRGKGHAVLAGAGFGDDFLLAHVFGQKRLAHAVVQLMGAGVVQVLPLDIQLYIAQLVGKTLQMGNRGGPSLKLLADAAQFINELAGLADGEIGLRDLIHSGLQFGRDIGTAVSAETAVGVRIVLKVSVEFNAVVHHDDFLHISK